MLPSNHDDLEVLEEKKERKKKHILETASLNFLKVCSNMSSCDLAVAIEMMT